MRRVATIAIWMAALYSAPACTTARETHGGPSGSGGSGGSGGSSGTAGAQQGTSSAGGGPVGPEACTAPPSPGLPASAPVLEPGVWKAMSPMGWPFAPSPSDAFTQGIAIDPCNPSILYLCVCSFDPGNGGLFRSLDAGSTWSKVGKIASVPPNTSSYIDEPIHIRIDPKDPLHIYAVDGVRGGSQGFWVSHDGGDTFEQPASFGALQASEGLFPYDIYDIAVDPTDFNHILLSAHSAWGWTDTKWDTNSGVFESKDAGASWIVHEPMSGWGTGHAINFLYNPELGFGDSNTWLLGTQGPGMWRTTDAGKTWTQVASTPIQHGGGTVYYTKKGVLYASGGNGNLRSTDNGASWTVITPGRGYNAVMGDGERLYTGALFTSAPFLVSPEDDGTTWTSLDSQNFTTGPYEMAFDAVNRIVYTASWGDGVWALKLDPKK